MIRWFRSLNLFYKAFFISFVLVVFVSFVLFLLTWSKGIDIFLGFLLGGICSSLIYLFFALSHSFHYKKGLFITISIIILSFIFHFGVLILSALLAYVLNIYLFNVFAVFIAEIIPTLVFLSVNLITGKIANGQN